MSKLLQRLSADDKSRIKQGKELTVAWTIVVYRPFPVYFFNYIFSILSIHFGTGLFVAKKLSFEHFNIVLQIPDIN